MKKASLSLSLNFIVMLIISLVVFMIGLYILKIIFSIEPFEKPEVNECVPNNVCFDRSIVDIQRGKNDAPIFRIKNNYDERKSFSYEVDCNLALDLNENEICSDETTLKCNQEEWLIKKDKFIINAYSDEEGKMFFSIPKDAKKGTYFFIIQFYETDIDGNKISEYDTSKKFKINVI